MKIVTVHLIVGWVEHSDDYMQHGMLDDEVYGTYHAIEKVA